MIEKLKSEILRASIELNSTRLTYAVNFWFAGPSHSLTINSVELFIHYDIQSGWNGMGEHDLEALEKEGFLKKIMETIDELDPLEKRIEYEIIKNGR